MFNNAGVPNMRTSEHFNFTQNFRSKICQFTDSVLFYRTVAFTRIILIPEQARKHLINNHLLSSVHNKKDVLCTKRNFQIFKIFFIQTYNLLSISIPTSSNLPKILYIKYIIIYNFFSLYKYVT